MKNKRCARLACLVVLLGWMALTGCNPAGAGPAPAWTATSALSAPALMPSITPSPSPVPWTDRLPALRWVAYSPTNADPNRVLEASPESIRQDLKVLRQAGFTGLVTYSSFGQTGRLLPQLAREAGFEGLIVGIWDPASEKERAAAVAAADNPIVLGYCIGNEGLHKRYELADLAAALDALKTATGKPVTTTEEIDDYSDEALLALGDWVFPNAHPYFHNQIEPAMAVQWTVAAYADLLRRVTARPVMFKEVGLPTRGDDREALSEENQAAYYRELAQTDVKFVYFEGFDQEWKVSLPVEPHWGIFRADRSPKLLAYELMGIPPVPTATPEDTDFYVYRDVDYPGNHFAPTGYMGDTGDIILDRAWGENPHTGNTAIRIVYTAAGTGSVKCGGYRPPCKWAGVYWQEPPNNWGTDAIYAGMGFDLTGYTRLVFWARADAPVRAEFKVGGIIGQYGDSLRFARAVLVELTPTWREVTIDLKDANLSHVIGGFAWVANWDEAPDGAVIYLDDIRFVK